MKFLFVLFAALALGSGTLASPVASKNLNDDLLELVDLFPLDEMLLVLLNALGDPEVQNVIVFIFSEEFVSIITEVETIPEFNAVLDFLESAGLPVRAWIAVIKDVFGISKRSINPKSGGLNGLVDDILALLDLDAFVNFYNDKMQTSAEFRNLIEKLVSEEFQELTTALANNQQIQIIEGKLKAAGIDIDYISNAIRNFFGL